MKRLTRATLDGTWANRKSEFAVCMGFDALRIAVGGKPSTFHPDDVVSWISTMRAALAAPSLAPEPVAAGEG